MTTPHIDYEAIKRRSAVAQFGFGMAIVYLKRGHRVRRSGWNGKGMWIRRIDFSQDAEFSYRENAYAEGTLMPFVVIKTPDNQLFPWNPSQQDMMADDWEIEGPLYLFALYDGPGSHKTLPTFRVTLKKFWDHKHCLDDRWVGHPHGMLSPRFERSMDATYVFDGQIDEAVEEMFGLSWDAPEDFRTFVEKQGR
jgi:hypothetical protein